MTNERAIELLRRISDSQFDGPHGDERREALEMAVRALESNLVKESDDLVKDLVKDCISRKMAIDAVEKKIRYTDHDEPVVDWNDFVAALCFLPSAQPQREKGKWINHRKDDGHNIADCDQCGNAIQWFDGDEIPRYCCMCGVDMRGESDGNN